MSLPRAPEGDKTALPKLLIFQVNHQNKTCLSKLEESKNDVSNPATTQPPNNVQKNNINFILRIKIKNIY